MPTGNILPVHRKWFVHSAGHDLGSKSGALHQGSLWVVFVGATSRNKRCSPRPRGRRLREKAEQKSTGVEGVDIEVRRINANLKKISS